MLSRTPWTAAAFWKAGTRTPKSSRLYRGRKLLQKMLVGYALESGVVSAATLVDQNADEDVEAATDLLEYKSRRARGSQH